MKKFLSLLLICSIFFVGNTTANAAEKDVYEQIVNEYNEMYDVSLEYVEADPNTDINEYRDFIARVAREERATLDYIANAEARNSNQVFNSIIAPRGTVTNTVTATKTASTGTYLSASAYSVTCTYDCYTNTSTTPVYTVGNASSVSVDVTSILTIRRYYTQDSWSSKRIDSGRTLGITSKGSVTEYFTASGTSNTVGNITVYAEFGWIN